MSKLLSSWWRCFRGPGSAPRGFAPGARVECLPARTMLSVDPALGQRLIEHGYQKITWEGHETFAEPGQWVVSLRNVHGSQPEQLATAGARLQRAAPRAGLRVTKALGQDGVFRVESPAGARLKDVRSALRRVGGVQFAEPNFAVWAQDMIPAGAPQTQAIPPDDPRYSLQWGLNNPGSASGTEDADIDAPEAWGIATGAANDVVVGVIDTGVDYNHPDLRDNIWVNPFETPGDGIDNDNNGYVDDIHGYDFVDLDNQPLDDHNHGTHVAGLIAASSDNGVGVTGVAWHAKIMALRFLSVDGFGGLDMAVEALNYAMKMKEAGVNIRVTNNSWGGADYSEALEQAIARSADDGMLFVAAAGNGGDDRVGDDIDVTENHFYPASHPSDNIISVTATDSFDRLASFSNYGAQGVDLAAPGVAILSTLRDGTYGYFNGTSMAAPLVSGVAALAFSLRPDATWQEVRDAIFAGADPRPGLAGKTVTGGRLNAYNTLLRLATPAVVGRHVFYNNSAFDGRSAAPGPADDNAVAVGKVALRPGEGPATFANYTSYSKGINGVMVDVRNLPAGDALSAADFDFSIGTDADLLQSWQSAPLPASVSVRRGAGVGGSDRVTITFPDGAVKNTWLRVTVLANDRTGLSSPDAFYFGNAVGETGNSPIDALVNAVDLGLVRANVSAAPVLVGNAFDLNRDGRVNAMDLLATRRNRSPLPLPLITLPDP